MKVVILHEALAADARADEADVLDQVVAIADALDQLGHQHSIVTMTGDQAAAEAALRAEGPDAVFNLVEGLDGSGRALDLAPELLERMGLPFTGSGSAATRGAASKIDAKRILAEHDLPSPLWLSLEQLRQRRHVPSGRYILKSIWEHGSLGLEDDCVLHADSAEQLEVALEQRLDRLGGAAFAEAYVHGREFNLALLSTGDCDSAEHLPPAEIRFAKAAATAAATSSDVHIVGYRAKWSPGSAEDEGTPRSFALGRDDAFLVGRMRRFAEAAWAAFELRGYARVDFRVDDEGQPWIIDVNTNPCLSPDAGFAAALRESGIPFARAVERILAAAFAQAPRQ